MTDKLERVLKVLRENHEREAVARFATPGISSNNLRNEEVDLTQYTERGSIGVDDESVRDNINTLLTSMLSCSFVTPYVGLEKAAKVLANFHIHLPRVTYLEGEHGVQVFEVNQFGEMMGMKNDGSVVTKTEVPYKIYFEYLMNDNGRFDIFCEIVDEDDLDELLDDVEDDMDTPEEEKEERFESEESNK